MSRQLEQVREMRQSKADRKLVAAIEYDLEGSVAYAGGVLIGFSVRCSSSESLVTLRASLAGRRQIAFVGAQTMAEAICKVVRLGYEDKLTWRPDKYEKEPSLPAGG